MATPQRQLSRSRPMKATEPFGSGTVNTGKQSGYWTQGSPLCGVPLSKKTEFRERRTSPITQATGLPSPIEVKVPAIGLGRCTTTPSPTIASGFNPRRSNSVGALNENDWYMNSKWLKKTFSEKAVQTGDPATKTVEDVAQTSGGRKLVRMSTHKRSNSYSNAYGSGDRTSESRKMLGPGHLTDSLEVLQCLGGKEDLREQQMHPIDGRTAPIQELVSPFSQLKPPNDSNSTPPNSTPPSPMFPLMNSVSTQTSHVKSPPTQSPLDHLVREGSPEVGGCFQKNPPSPKPTFVRGPPDGAERCTIKPLFSLEHRPIQAPDSSKIHFKLNPGGVFQSPIST